MRMVRSVALLLALLLVSAGPARPTLAFIPPGFANSPTLLSLGGITALAFTPDEQRLLIATRDGQLFGADVEAGGGLSLQLTPMLDLSGRTCTEFERGLVGAVADPDYANSRHIYVFYTYDRGLPADVRCATNSQREPISVYAPVNRVSRFTVGEGNVADLSSERVLVDNILSPSGRHNAGDLHFGEDGYLYISIGDGGCDYNGTGCNANNDAARDQNVLLGKILRIIANPDLSPEQRIPPSNPYAATGTVCAPLGRGPAGTPVSTPCRETFASGLRNPFRMAFDPDTIAPATQFYINDVGQERWEEINRGTSGADYRWPLCEGNYFTGTNDLCGAPSAPEQNAIFAYNHDDGCSSITAGAVVPRGVWPSGYDGAYLFADYVCGRIFQINPAAPGQRLTFADGLGPIVTMVFGPAPDGSRALYYATFDTGELHRITLTAPGNRAPIAVLSASPQYGELAVTFDGSQSEDPDGESLTYLWTFGDGQTRETTTPTTSYTYAADGQYTAILQVRDPSGALSNSASLPIDTANDPPQVTLSAPLAGATFGVGESIPLQASATDIQDGVLGDAAFRWEVLLVHRFNQPGEHTHPYFGPRTGASLSFAAAAPEDLDAASNSYLLVRLTVTDSGGARTVVTRELQPEKVMITVNTQPAGLQVTVNGALVSDGQPFVSWRGYALTLQAFPQRLSDGRWIALSDWEDASVASIREVVTGSAPASYTATFGRDAALVYKPTIVKP